MNSGHQLPATPLEHPLRRRILRSLDRAGGSRPVAELAEDVGASLKSLMYHGAVLEKFETLTLPDRREGLAGLVEAKPIQDAWVTRVLDATEEADDWTADDWTPL